MIDQPTQRWFRRNVMQLLALLWFVCGTIGLLCMASGYDTVGRVILHGAGLAAFVSCAIISVPIIAAFVRKAQASWRDRYLDQY